MELVLRQGNVFRKEGIGDFLNGEYRPGLESHGAPPGAKG
jgi:trans-feruloyl-CoA hydratase/vanillin synthase